MGGAGRRARAPRRLAAEPERERHDHGDDDGHDHDDAGREAHEEHHEETLGVLPDDVAGALRQLRDHDAEISKALSDPERAEQYYRDPIATLRSLGIEVPKEIGRYASKLRQPAPPRMTFRIPTGQLVRPKVNVRFTGRKGR